MSYFISNETPTYKLPTPLVKIEPWPPKDDNRPFCEELIEREKEVSNWIGTDTKDISDRPVMLQPLLNFPKENLSNSWLKYLNLPDTSNSAPDSSPDPKPKPKPETKLTENEGNTIPFVANYSTGSSGNFVQPNEGKQEENKSEIQPQSSVWLDENTLPYKQQIDETYSAKSIMNFFVEQIKFSPKIPEVCRHQINELLHFSTRTIQQINQNGFSAIHLLVVGNYIDALLYLISHGQFSNMNMNARDYQGDTALHLAVKRDDRENKRIVESFGYHYCVDVNAQNNKGQTPLHIAVLMDSDQCFDQLLFFVQTDLNARDENRQTPLHLAVIKNRKRMLSALLEWRDNNPPKTKIDAQDNKGNTALHLAAMHNRFDLVNLLLQNGADKTIMNDEGKVALEMTTNQNIIQRLSNN